MITLLPTALVGLCAGVAAIVWGQRMGGRVLGPSPDPLLIRFAVVALGIVGAAVGVVITFVPVQVLAAAMARRALINGCLRQPICPSCGYHLEDLPPESDGCTVCPECGAAWRLP